MGKRGKTEKVCVTIPEDLAKEVRATVSHGEVSAFVTKALEFYIRLLRQQVGLKAGLGAWKDENHPDLMTPEDTIRYVNSLRSDRQFGRRVAQ